MSRAKEAGACIYAEACKYIEKLSVEQCGQILINLLATTLPELGLKSIEITDGRTEVVADRIICAAVRAMENFNNQKDNRSKGQLKRWEEIKLIQNDSNCVKLSQNETYNINRTNIIESNKEIDTNVSKESKPKKIDFLANCKNRSAEYDTIMLEWLEYKKERKDKLTSIGICKTYAKLIRLSDGNAENAKAIIEDAIANGYQGFFQLKENKGGAAKAPERPKSQIRGEGWVDKEHYDHW